MHVPDYVTVKADDKGALSFVHNHFHIDHQLGKAHEVKKWNTFAPTWWLAGQSEGESHISGQSNVRLWWNWKARGRNLPFIFLPNGLSADQRSNASEYLHAGYNLVGQSLVDIGITQPLSNAELMKWMTMIAQEAMEQWLLPGFEIPPMFPEIVDKAKEVWGPGVLSYDAGLVKTIADYPCNGLCGGMPGFQ